MTGLKKIVLLLAAFWGGAGLIGAQEGLDFSQLYKPGGVLGLSFTSRVKDLEGKRVTMSGYMAPPLKAIGRFFVLTREPVTLCPFCQTDADWPEDILVVYLRREQTFRQLNRQLEVTGVLETGSFTDPETGFVSLLRLRDAEFNAKEGGN